MMKVGVVTPAYNEERLIGACIKQFDGFPIEHLVLISKTPWNGPHYPPDKTEEIAKKLGATVIVGNFPPDEGQRHAGLDYFKEKGFSWCLIVDADELYTKEDIKKILNFLKDADGEIYRCDKMYVYFKNLDHIAIKKNGEDHIPPVIAMKPHQRLIHIRDVNCPTANIPVTLYHLSYIRTNNELKKKISSWGHSHEIVPDWYENIWLKWTPETTNFHPTEPSVFHRAIKHPLPKELKELVSWSQKLPTQ